MAPVRSGRSRSGVIEARVSDAGASPASLVDHSDSTHATGQHNSFKMTQLSELSRRRRSVTRVVRIPGLGGSDSRNVRVTPIRDKGSGGGTYEQAKSARFLMSGLPFSVGTSNNSDAPSSAYPRSSVTRHPCHAGTSRRAHMHDDCDDVQPVHRAP